MKRILVTGANGYIGKAICQRYENEYTQVTRLTRQVCDLTDFQTVRQYFQSSVPFDCVIHCATQGGSRLRKDDQSVCFKNILMVRNILDARTYYSTDKRQYVNAWGRMLVMGSGAQFDYQKSRTPYGLSKRMISQLVHGLEFVSTIRIWAIFDQNELDTRFIKSNILRYINHQPMIIHQNMRFDFFHMSDFLSLVDRWLDAPMSFHNISCAYSNMLFLKDIAELINTQAEYKVPIIVQHPNSKWVNCHRGSYCARSRLPIFGVMEDRIKDTYQKIKEQV